MSFKKKYSHIFFDLDNTLWDFGKNSRFAMESAFKYFKLNEQGVNFLTFFETYSVHNRDLWAAYRKKEILKKDLIRKRFYLTFESFGIKKIIPEDMNEKYLDEMPKQKYLNEGAIEVLEYLKSKRYKMFIVTNGFRDVQYKKLHSSGLMPFFEKVFISEEIKTPKPGREIFEFAIKSANAKKSGSLMIGDDWDVDIKGAENFGIDSVYYSPSGKTNSNVSQIDNTVGCKKFKIMNLRELKDIL